MIFKRWFDPGTKRNRAVSDVLYERIVAAARQTAIYASWDVPDTPLGRFEMVGLHVFLFLHRVRGESAPISEIAQTLTDEFFTDVDSSLRELGIGDAGVPKRVKKLAKMFYGRVNSYSDALDRADEDALAKALTRNVRPDVTDWEGGAPLAAYVFEAVRMLAEQRSESLLAGEIMFPDAGRMVDR